MKKLLFMSFAVLLLAGCGSEDDNLTTEERAENTKKEDLIVLAKEMYMEHVEPYINHTSQTHIQEVTLDQLNQLSYDTAEFDTCNIITTKVEITTVYDENGDVVGEREYLATLDCE